MTVLDKIIVAKSLIKQSRFAEAEVLLKAIKLKGQEGEIQQLLGLAVFKLNREAEAVKYFELALYNLPENGFLYNNLALAYKAIGNFKDSKKAFKKAAELEPNFAEPLNQLAMLQKEGENLVHAERLYREAIDRDPNYVEAYFNLAFLMEESNRLVEACDYYRIALELRPNYIRAINNLAGCLTDLGNFDEAESLYCKGIKESRYTAELHSGLGSCLSQQGKFSAARRELTKAVDFAPDSNDNKWNLGFLQLSMSDLRSGWANYRYRNSVDRRVLRIPKKRFQKSLRGKMVGIASEQGLGDQLFFARFFPELKMRGAKIFFNPDKKLESIFERVNDVIINHNQKAYFSMGDLPFLLGSDSAVPSLQIQPLKNLITRLQRKLNNLGPPPFIGVTYRAGGVNKNTLFKEVPFENIALSLRHIQGTILCLQRNPKPGELELFSSALGREFFDFTHINNDLEEALALISLLDDYVGVSNTNMHLRTAVGKPARVLVTHPGEFRWQLEGNFSPWFPSFQLYRQSIDGSWDQAFSKLKIDLIQNYD